jgi:copper chaperone CopZ
MSMIEFALNEVACSGCIGKIKRKMQRTVGVDRVKIVSGSGRIQVNYNEELIQADDINQSLHKITLRSFD